MLPIIAPVIQQVRGVTNAAILSTHPPSPMSSRILLGASCGELVVGVSIRSPAPRRQGQDQPMHLAWGWD